MTCPKPAGFEPIWDRDGVPRCDSGMAALSCHIVHGRVRAYLMEGGADPLANGVSMPDSTSLLQPRSSRPLVIVVAAVGLLLAGTVALWAHYGTAVFYEMIVAGLAACF